MRKALIAVVLVALAVVGTASALAITRHVTLKAGACITVKATRVCAAKSKTRTIVDSYTVTTPGQTVTTPGQTVTTPGQTVTMTVTTPAATPPPPPTTTTPTSSPVTEDFSGVGNQDLAPFTTPVGETLSWTSSWSSGCSISDCNGDIGIFDFGSPGGTLVDASNQAAGSTYLLAGSHQLDIVDESGANWTIHVG